MPCSSSSSLSDACGVDDFRMGPRRSAHAHAVLQAANVSLDPSARPIQSLFQNHIIPAVAMAALAQHRAVQQFTERLSAWRPRLPWQRRNRGDEEAGMSSMDMHTGPRASRSAQRLYDAALEKEKELDPVGAAELFRAAYEADIRQSEWLSRLAKALSDQTYLDCHNHNLAVTCNSRAIEVADQAVQAAPSAAHGYIARCVSRGRLALYSDNRTKVHLAAAAAEDAKQALALEPRNDYAHHLAGRWHYEMASINAVVRTVVRLMYGASLMSGSYAQALEHYRTAAQLGPRVLVHRVELGRTLYKLGQPEAALQELETALALEVQDLNGALQRADAEDMVRRIRASPAARALLLAALPPANPGSAPSA